MQTCRGQTCRGQAPLYADGQFRAVQSIHIPRAQPDRCQTGHKPAQGGFDFAHESGFYLGTWASNISWLKENASLNGGGGPNIITGTYQSGGSLEWDFYGGYKWNLPNDFVLDFGTLYYAYPGNTSAAYNAVVTPLVPGFSGAPGRHMGNLRRAKLEMDHLEILI